jgi:hypothetical protein
LDAKIRKSLDILNHFLFFLQLGGLRLCHGEKTKVSTIRPKDEVLPFNIHLIEDEEENVGSHYIF